MHTILKAGTLALAGAIGLAGCQATQTQGDSAGVQTGAEMVTAATETTTTVAETPTAMESAGSPQPSGLAALEGHWTGRWGGQAKSTVTVSTDPDSVEYCFKDECWDIEEFTVEGSTLGWRWRSSVFEFTLEGETLRGKLKRSQGTHRIKMKRM